MLTEKYKPESLEEVAGNGEQIKEIEAWLKSWKRGEALFLYGPSGCGKSLAIELLAKKLRLELIESHANESRSYKELKEGIMKSVRQQSLLYRGKIILIDEAEALDSVKGVLEMVKESSYPVVLVGSDPYEGSLYALRKCCRLVKFGGIKNELIASFLGDVCRKEGIEYDGKALSQLAKLCNSDIRAALNDIETLPQISASSVGSIPSRIQERDIFNTLKIIFKTKSLQNAAMALQDSDKSPEDVMLWLEENIPEEYEDAEEIAMAYDYLSKADVFFARRQQKYCNDIGIFGVSLSKKSAYKKFTRYSFPRFIKKTLPDSLMEKLGKHLHVSKKKSLQYLRLISLVMNEDMASKLTLDEADLEALDHYATALIA